MRKITIKSSPFQEDYQTNDSPPWSWNEGAFINWVDEVLREGYKKQNPPMTLEESMEFARNFGYVVEIE